MAAGSREDRLETPSRLRRFLAGVMAQVRPEDRDEDAGDNDVPLHRGVLRLPNNAGFGDWQGGNPSYRAQETATDEDRGTK